MIKAYTPADLPQINEWFKANNWPTFQEEALPKTGYIADNTAAGFLYKTDSKFAVMEWIVTDPSQSPERRNAALDAVVKALLDNAKADGYKYIHTSIIDEGLKKRYQSHGFQITDTNMINMMRIL